MGSIFRLYELGNIPPSVYIDEVWAVYVPRLYQSGLIDLSPHAILVHFIMGTYYVYGIFGHSAFFTRLPAAIYGIMLVALIYFMAKEMFNTRIGLLSAALTALCPWAMIFSRYEVPSISSVFWLTLAIYLLYKGSKLKERKRLANIWLGSLILGLSLNTLVILRVFVSIFLFGLFTLYVTYVHAHTQKFDRKKIIQGIGCVALFLLGASPVIYEYVGYSSSTEITLSTSYSTFAHTSTWLETISSVAERFYLHLSPDFLALTGGASFAGSEGFQPVISATGLLNYSTGTVGMLNYYGILIYPAISYLAYKVVRKKGTIENKLLLWWIFSYALASTTAYYDNPNSARNIAGLPALIIVLALTLNFIYTTLGGLCKNRKFENRILIFGMVMIILLPSAYFLTDYFAAYPMRSARSFDYGFRQIADVLTETKNWERPVILYSLPARNWNLAFYSPDQPFEPDRFSVVFPPFDFVALFENVRNIPTEVGANISIVYGSLEYKFRIDKGYGTATSSHMWLDSNEGGIIALSIYAQNSTYNPNYYLLSQEVNGNVLFIEEGFLNKIIEYGKSYTVRLILDDTTMHFYFDDELIIKWQRPTCDVYNFLRLGGESGAVTFTDLKMVSDGYSKFFGVSNWRPISGTWTIDQDVLQGDPSVILVLAKASDLQLLSKGGVEYRILEMIRYPEKEVAFWVILIPP